ncbi:MAG: ABC transporter ATP-binding protein [Wolinella succinogenes]|nr:ABC transporter ATP-binding protein [Wolinella succinogenes]
MLEMIDFSLWYEEENHQLLALDHCSLSLQGGSITALVGESGSGKSTLAKSLMGCLPAHAKTQGKIKILGEDWLSLTPQARRERLGKEIAWVPQGGAENLNPLLSLETLLLEILPPQGAQERIKELLPLVGLAKRHLQLYSGEMSGGEAQRALLALALANDPKVVILDEPTGALDQSSRDFIAHALKRLRAQGKAILLITHDLELASTLSDETLILYMGQLLERLPSSKLFDESLHPYTIALARVFPRENRHKDIVKIKGEAPYRLLHRHDTLHTLHQHDHLEHLHLPDSGCLYAPRCTQALPECFTSSPPYQEQENRSWRCFYQGMQELLNLENITHHYGSFQALQGLSLRLLHGEIYSLVGASGSGKSTLAWIAAGVLKPTQGRRTPKEGLRIGMVYQNPLLALSPRLSILESLLEPLRLAKIPPKEAEDQAFELAKAAGLKADLHLLKRYPHELSLGTLQRVCIARALANSPELLIADEPTSALDPSVQACVIKTLLELQVERGLSVLFITHHLALARKISDRIGLLHEGKLSYEGSVEECPLFLS